MTKKFGMGLLRKNAKRTKKTMDSLRDDMHCVLLEQIYGCDDGKALARAHSKEGPLLIAGVFMLMGDLLPVEDQVRQISPNSPIWDYLELGLELLGFTEDSKKVRVNFERVAIQMWCRSGSGEISKTLDDYMARQTPPTPPWLKSSKLQLVR